MDLHVYRTQERTLVSSERLNTRDGIRTLATIKVPHYDRYGRCDGILGIGTDITELHDARASFRSKMNFSNYL